MQEKYYVDNIFTTNYRWLVIIGFNLNSPLKLLFYLLIIVNNNLVFKIYYKSVV